MHETFVEIVETKELSISFLACDNFDQDEEENKSDQP